jgi:type II secretory pathway pseudopilin PulG
MSVQSIAAPCRRPPRGSAPGFTLAEALIAMALMSIITGMAFSFYSFTHKQVTLRESKAFEFDNAVALLDAISTNIRQSKGTILLDAQRWVFITERGDTASYTVTDGALKFKNLELTVGGKPIAGLSFTALGNDSLLDINNDREVEFSELDLNSDGRIDGPETENIALIKVSLSLHKDSDDSLSTVEAVKNNLEYTDGQYQTYF